MRFRYFQIFLHCIFPNNFRVCDLMRRRLYYSLFVLCVLGLLLSGMVSAVSVVPDCHGTITGYKQNYISGDGLSGWTIQLKKPGGSVYKTTTTGANGYFSFTDIELGTYWLNETPREGWTQRTPNVSVTFNDNNWEQTFCYTFRNEQNLGDISGYKKDPAGTTIPGVTVSLVFLNGTVFRTTSTDGTGKFSFTGVPWGTYWLNETAPAGWTQVTPNTQVTIDGTHLAVSYDFVNRQNVGAIHGFKRDTGGDGLGGWTITLREVTTSAPDFSTVTDGSGAFSFTDVPFGAYWLNETMKQGWKNITPSNQVVVVDGQSQEVTHTLVNERSPGRISGYKLNDYNANGKIDPSDDGLPGWTIRLFYPNGTMFAQTTTNADGFFRFINVPWGTYTLKEVPKAGWTQTMPGGTKTYKVKINAASLVVTNKIFMNQRNPCNCVVTADFTYKQASSPAHTIKFTNTSAGVPVGFSWSFGDGDTSQLPNPLHTYSSAGAYTVQFLAEGYNCDLKTYYWSSNTQKITVK